MVARPNGSAGTASGGWLDAAIDAAIQAVKAKPGDMNARIFLFELLAAAGDFERAQKHLDVVGTNRPRWSHGVGSYRAVLTAELARARLFARGEGRAAADVTSAARSRADRSGAPPPARGRRRRGRRPCSPQASGAPKAAPRRRRRPSLRRLPRRRRPAGAHSRGLRERPLRLDSVRSRSRSSTFEAPRYLRDLLWRPVTVTLLGRRRIGHVRARALSRLRDGVRTTACAWEAHRRRMTRRRRHGRRPARLRRRRRRMRYVLEVSEIVFDA